jgi:putative addiction module component (TIGR02574 family)
MQHLVQPPRLEAEALVLPPEERVRLARRLLESLDDESGEDPDEIERLWIAEAERRYERHLQGGKAALPADEVLARVRTPPATVIPIRLLPEAETDIVEAAVFLSKRQPGLGNRFADAITSSFQRLTENSEIGPKVGGEIRNPCPALPLQRDLPDRS